MQPQPRRRDIVGREYLPDARHANVREVIIFLHRAGCPDTFLPSFARGPRHGIPAPPNEPLIGRAKTSEPMDEGPDAALARAISSGRCRWLRF